MSKHVSLKSAIKSFIVCYYEDYGKLPTIYRLQSLFNLSKEDASIALRVYGYD
ncbi:hypothetical protein GCM10011409_45920 [Lentibacillus populi]|uniref:Uncharacterized protein n=1 Tax=Lentibacillus populi TaxID=1827502 RepID=A0A9W5U2X0_9BACI|nr:hypothetical protein GCM10011409_45920 [Lentibacillus populi]